MNRKLLHYLWVPFLLLGCGIVSVALAGRPERAAPRSAKEAQRLPTGRSITPYGAESVVGSFPTHLAVSPDGKYVAVSTSGASESLAVLRADTGEVVQEIPVNASRKDGSGDKEGLYYGLAWDGGSLFASRGAEDRVAVYQPGPKGPIDSLARSLTVPTAYDKGKTPRHVAGIALNGDGTRLHVVLNNTGAFNDFKGYLATLDARTGKILSDVPVPGFPYAVAALTVGAQAGRKVYVSSERDGCVAVVDPDRGLVIRTIPTGTQPISLLFNGGQSRLYVANAGSDTVSVIDTATDAVIATMLVRPDDARGLPGATPTGLALSPDGKRLYVALADMNAVGVIDVAQEKLVGMLPAGWYPTDVAVSNGGKTLLIANARGTESTLPNRSPGNVREKKPNEQTPGGKYYIENLFKGVVSRVAAPEGEELERLTKIVLRNNAIKPGMGRPPKGWRNPGIEHVIYVLKENRTYDQILGDLRQGNGEPELCLFPREVTPNQHALAERFGLYDNFYVCAEVSAHGWNWSTSGMISEYVARNAVYSYAGRGREYDFEGSNNGVPVDLMGIPDVARAPSGYLWELAANHGVSFRNYGFFTTLGGTPDGGPVGTENRATKKALAGKTDTSFLKFDMQYADSDAWVRHNAPMPLQKKTFGAHGSRSRFEEWKREFDQHCRDGNLPQLSLVRLPRDHTNGTSAGYHSPRAMVADNDFAVGQLVEAVSKSPYWKKTAIFIIEDDAQNGFDHVDAHRSVCWVISPFCKQGRVDSRFYNTDSVLRTMELLLGLPPMSQYDAIAPVLDVFDRRPNNDAPFEAILPDKAIIGEVNQRTAYRSADSARLNFAKEDAVRDDLLNDILWHALKGRNTPKPSIRYGLITAAREVKEDEDD